MPRFPGFIGGSGTVSSLLADAEETVNLYVEPVQSQALPNAAALYPTPGFTAWSTVPDVVTRATIVANGRMFAVIGQAFYEFDQNGVATKRGTVAIDGNPAQIIYNGVVGGQLGIAAGGNFYCYVLATNVLTQVLTGEATMIAYAAGFGLAFNGTTGKVRLSNLNDLTMWDPGTFFQRSLFADPWQALFVDANNLIWLPGVETFEVWYNTGQGTQPWAPLSGLVGRYGIAAPFAFGQSGAGHFWLARNAEGAGQFVLARGGVQPVSTYAVHTAVAGYLRTSRISDAEVMVYQQQGHTFANLTFPSANATWSYDVETQSWTKRGRWNSTTGVYDLWAPRTHCFAFNKHLVGDRLTGTIWAMDTTVATDTDGTGIRRLRRAPGLINDAKRIPIDQIQLFMDVGFGVPAGQGSDPQAMLRVSQDGGRTYGNERRAGIGRIGEFRRRVTWTRLGAPPDAVIEVSYTDPTPFRVVDAFINNAEAA